MPQIRDEGQINNHTYLIDAIHEGMRRAHAVYLLKSRDGGTCLVDSGTKDSATVICQKLKALEAWPVDRIIFTHSHWDHTQGIGYLRQKAEEDGCELQVLASEKAMPYLADQSYNVCFGTDQMPYLNIEDVKGLKGGQQIEIGADLTIAIIDTPGHMVDHISIWDESTGNVMVGDAIGMRWTDNLIVSNPNSTFWRERDFLDSIDTLKSLDIQTIGLSHFGLITGDDAQNFLDDTVDMYRKWMAVFSDHMDKLDDIPFLVKLLLEEAYSHLPDRLKGLIQPGLMEAVEMGATAYAKQHPAG